MGYKLSNDMNSENVVQALEMAIKNKDRTNIHHSDRNLKYCSNKYQQKLSKSGMTPSMRGEYDCYQNTLAERMVS